MLLSGCRKFFTYINPSISKRRKSVPFRSSRDTKRLTDAYAYKSTRVRFLAIRDALNTTTAVPNLDAKKMALCNTIFLSREHVVKGASILTQEISAQLKAKLTIRL